MASKSGKGKKSAGKAQTIKAIVTNEVGNYEKHPFFVKKANEAKELLQKIGLPKVLPEQK
jgi:hypothetical protein